MQTTFANVLFALLLCATIPQHIALASEQGVQFTQQTWFTATHPRILTFTVHEDGSAYGLTVTGIRFVQYPVPNDAGIRIQRFEIQDHYHYIVEGDVIYTHTELSARLAQAYRQLQTESSS